MDVVIEFLTSETGYSIARFFGIVLVPIVIWIGISTVKYLKSIYKSDKAMLILLQEKSIAHDQEHMEINKNIQAILKEQKLNREADRTLLTIVAKEVGIDLPLPK